VIVLGGYGDDIGLGVRAMKAGAADFLHAPYERETLFTAVATALADMRQGVERDRTAERTRARIAEMSARERQVLDRMLLGGTNKSIARELGISPRTVEIHRAHVMERLGARTFPEAVLLAVAGGLFPAHAIESSAPSDEPEAERARAKRRAQRLTSNASFLRGPPDS
jgi:FixJ family two-component response regulator